MVSAYLSLEYFSEFYRRIATERHAMVTLVSDQGLILTRWPAGNQPVGTIIGNGPTLQKIASGPPEGFLQVQHFVGTEESVFVAYRKVTGAPLIVTYARSCDDTLAAWQVRSRQHLTFSGTILVLITLLTIVLFLQV